MACILELPQLPEDDGVSQRRSGRLESTPSFTRSGRPAASRSSRPPFGTRSTLPLASVVSTSAAMARRCYRTPPILPQDAGYTRPR